MYLDQLLCLWGERLRTLQEEVGRRKNDLLYFLILFTSGPNHHNTPNHGAKRLARSASREARRYFALNAALRLARSAKKNLGLFYFPPK